MIKTVKYSICSLIFLALVVVPSSYEVQAQDLPSITELVNCVSFFSRIHRVRENDCKWYEFEVTVEGGGAQGPPGPPGPPADPSTICPCFDQDILRVGFSVISLDLDPQTDLVCRIVENPGILISYVLSLDADAYVRLTNAPFTPAAICDFDPFLSNQSNPEVITNEQFEVCEGFVLDWLIELGKDPTVDCPS